MLCTTLRDSCTDAALPYMPGVQKHGMHGRVIGESRIAKAESASYFGSAIGENLLKYIRREPLADVLLVNCLQCHVWAQVKNGVIVKQERVIERRLKEREHLRREVS